MQFTKAITLESITKTYRLYKRNSDRIKETFHPLRKQYHRPFPALKDVTFSVNQQESVGIIGKNGSGKSTLLQILCGVLQPSSGHLHVEGKISALLELGAGFNPDFTGRENVYLSATIMGFSTEYIIRILIKYLILPILESSLINPLSFIQVVCLSDSPLPQPSASTRIF